MDEQFAKVKTGGLRLKGEKVGVQNFLLKLVFFSFRPDLRKLLQIVFLKYCYFQVKKHKKHKKSKKREREDGDGEEEEVKRSKKDFKEDSIKHGGW